MNLQILQNTLLFVGGLDFNRGFILARKGRGRVCVGGLVIPYKSRGSTFDNEFHIQLYVVISVLSV